MVGGFKSRQGLEIFLFTTAFIPAVARPASYSMGTRGSFIRVKEAGA
jgi:hypothetical protein